MHSFVAFYILTLQHVKKINGATEKRAKHVMCKQGLSVHSPRNVTLQKLNSSETVVNLVVCNVNPSV